MIFEDVHWVDPTSLEALDRTVDRIKTLPVLLIVTYRPEFEAPWVGRSRVTCLTLTRLGGSEIAAIIASYRQQSAAREHQAEIVERTDGIPLFVEEMTKAVLEAESEGEAQRTVVAIPAPALAVPASLHASLMARLDSSAQPRRWRRSEPRLGGSFPMLCWRRSRANRDGIGSALDRLISGFAVSARRAAARDLFVQARPCAGRGLWHAAARATKSASRPHR